MNHENENSGLDLSRRNFLGVGSAALATATLSAVAAHAQEQETTRKAEADQSSSDPAQENNSLLDEKSLPADSVALRRWGPDGHEESIAILSAESGN